MKLWFENSEGIRSQIADCTTWTEVCDAIDEFIDQCNEDKPANKRFISHYKRVWQENGMTKIDVGSWSEFFYWENTIESLTMNKDNEAKFEYEQ